MYVQVFDKPTEQYYKSVVYAIIECKEMPVSGVSTELSRNEEFAVLYNPIIDCFELLPKFDISWELFAGIPTMNRKLNYTVIQPAQVGWKALPEALIAQYTEDRVVSAIGFSDIIDQPAIIRRFLTDKRINAQEAGIPIRIPEDANEWTYVLTQQDANGLTSVYNNFHDAVIDQIHYVETDTRSFAVTVTLSMDNEKTLELCFEGVIALNLRTQIEWQREMAFASLHVGNRLITWIVDESTQCLPNK
jgi:hypothetical protein